MRLMALSVSLLTLALTSGASALGRDDEWQSGWGQGMSEAVVTYGPGNRIFVSCNEGGIGETNISFALAGRAPTGDDVVLTFDGEDPERIWISNGRIPSNCRACASTFDYVIDKLKTHLSVHVLFENGDGARFTLKGAAEAIGDCVPDFAR